MDKIDTFANRLNLALKRRNMKATELSLKTGISKSSLSEYLKGKYEAKQTAIYLISKVLDISPSWLLGLDVPMEKQTDELENKLLKLNNYMDENNLNSIKLIPIFDDINLKVDWINHPTRYTPFDAKIQGCPEDRNYFYYKISENSMNIEKDSYILIEDTTDIDINDIILYSIDKKNIELGIYKLNLKQEKDFIVLGKYIK